MHERTDAEPSLEEILASIRRIISEDGPATVSSYPAMRPLDAEEADDVLVLTRRAPAVAKTMTNTAEPKWPPHTRRAAHEPALDPLQAPVLEVAPGHPEAAPAAPAEAEPIVTRRAEESAAAAFEKLSLATREAPRPSILMPPPGRTIEDVVRDLMQPLIKEWLDENLAAIVEKRVEEEIERISRHRVR